MGIVLMCLGFAGQGFKQSTPGADEAGTADDAGRLHRADRRVESHEDGQKQMITGHFRCSKAGKQSTKMYPARWFFNKHEEPTTEVAIRRKFEEDLYLELHDFQVADQTASLQIMVNPLVNWIWLGFGMMALGTGIVLLPERSFSFAWRSSRPEVATTAGCPRDGPLAATPRSHSMEKAARQRAYLVLRAQRARATASARNRLHVRDLRPASIGECRKDPCPVSHRLRGELAAMMDQGKSHDEIIQSFVTLYGSEEMLGAPINKGFNRLAWLFRT